MSWNTRTKGYLPGVVTAVVCSLAATAALASGAGSGRELLPSGGVHLYSGLPLHFEANQGQVDREVRFLARGAGYTLYFTPAEAVFVVSRSAGEGKPLSSDVVRMRLLGARPGVELRGADPLPGRSNYFTGSGPADWHTNVPHFSRVEYQGIYPGVDLVHYGRDGQLEYDFVVAPGADPSAIRIAIFGASRLTIDTGGNLVVRTRGGELVQQAPIVYQETDHGRQPLPGRFVLKPHHQVAFEVRGRDPKLALVIDPVLSYSTYLGGNGTNDRGLAIAVLNGNAYVTGQTNSSNFPTGCPPGACGAAQTTNAGGTSDAFVTRFALDGQSLVYSTYLGGSLADIANGIAVDGAGNAYIVGQTVSTNFPLTIGLPYAGGAHDAFVTKLDSSGSIAFSRYLGGSVGGTPIGDDIGTAISIDFSGTSYVTGSTTSTDFPTLATTQGTTKGASTAPDAFVAKLDSSGALFYSRYLGGSGNDRGLAIATDAGNAYVTGSTASANFPTTASAFQATRSGFGNDAFVSVLDPTATLTYSTYLGGGADDRGLGIAVVPGGGNPFVTGQTSSPDFPTRGNLNRPPIQSVLAGGIDAFVTKLIPSASGAASLFYSTYLGGATNDVAHAIAAGPFGRVYIAGDTQSVAFPVANAFQPAISPNGGQDAFLARVDEFGSKLQYSTYLGGTGQDQAFGIAIDSSADAYVTGRTNATNFPTSSPFRATKQGAIDAFVTRMPFIEVTIPTAGDNLATGTTRDITWDTSLPVTETVNIDVDDGSGPGFVNVGSALATSGSFSWLVSAAVTPTTTAKVRVSWAVDPRIHYDSENFNIDIPTVTVTKPLAGQIFKTGQTKTVAWKHNLGPGRCFHIQVDRDGDTVFDEDIASTATPACYPLGFGNTFGWTVTPGATSSLAVIRVTECLDSPSCTLFGPFGDSPAFTIAP